MARLTLAQLDAQTGAGGSSAPTPGPRPATDAEADRAVRIVAGLLALARDDVDAAQTIVREELGAHPNSAEAMTLAALVALRTGDRARLRNIHQALTHTGQVQPAASLACAALLVGERQTGEARRVLENLVQRCPWFVPGWEMLIRLERAERRLDAAREHVHAMLRLDPGHPTANLYLANFLNREGRLDEAEAALRAALVRRRDGLLLNELAWTLLQQGQTGEALALAEEAVALAPSWGTALDTLGQVLDAMGRNDEARERYRAAVRADPENREIRAHLEHGAARPDSRTGALTRVVPTAVN
jgi:Tfp pilus assembly protein PilF